MTTFDEFAAALDAANTAAGMRDVDRMTASRLADRTSRLLHAEVKLAELEQALREVFSAAAAYKDEWSKPHPDEVGPNTEVDDERRLLQVL